MSVPYPEIAKAFVVPFCARILADLNKEGFISDEAIKACDPGARDTLFRLCFNALVQFEDLGGVTHGGTRYFAHGLIASSLTDPVEFFDQVTATDLHGNVEDDVLAEAFSIVSRQLEGR